MKMKLLKIHTMKGEWWKNVIKEFSRQLVTSMVPICFEMIKVEALRSTSFFRSFSLFHSFVMTRVYQMNPDWVTWWSPINLSPIYVNKSNQLQIQTKLPHVICLDYNLMCSVTSPCEPEVGFDVSLHFLGPYEYFSKARKFTMIKLIAGIGR